MKHPPIEKEAAAIIESMRHWRHLLTGKYFKLITDQKSVVFMLDKNVRSKIKNDKIYRWRVELSCYTFDIIYRKGVENIAADAISRIHCLSQSSVTLKSIHDSLCDPGVTRMTAFVRNQNLPYSVEDIRSMIKQCDVSQRCKPNFHKPQQDNIIKAMKPFKRLNIDFKGPIPSATKNIYMLTIIDEYSRFPFVYPCENTNTDTVIACLLQLFSLFGMPHYIHSDRGYSFMSREPKDYLSSKGIATGRMTPYNPQCNGQTERYNGIIMNTIKLGLQSKQLPIKYWEIMLPDALHLIRSLINTTTNETPHERLFNYQRKSTSGSSIPSWLSNPGKVLLKKFVRNSKYDQSILEVDLIDANPQFAHIQYPDGRESTVSIKHLAPLTPRNPDGPRGIISVEQPLHQDQGDVNTLDPPSDIKQEPESSVEQPICEIQPLRRSTRVKRSPQILDL